MSAAEQRHYCPVCNAVFRTPFSRCPLDGNVLSELEGDPLVGTTIDDRYVIEECIGEGGMGRVYRAKHTRMSRNYAIKILFGDHAGDSRMRSRFAREAEAVSRLHHTNVISVVDFGETPGGLLYLVMDLAKGESLAALVIREAPFTQERAVAILGQLAKGLYHAHSQGLVHRDFKGENVIMVREEEQEVPKIVDFGICMITEDSPSSTMLTSNGMVMGTPAVMAPEQASGDTVDHRTDLFSLGIVGYQMLSGKLPFEGTPLDMARKNLYEQIPPIYERSGIHVAPQLEAIIHKLTAKKPDDRYQNAKSALADLQALNMGWADVSTDWSAPTPMPAPMRADSSGGFTSPSTNGQQFDPTGGFLNQTSTPMTTEAVGAHGQLGRKRSRAVPVVVGLLAVAGIAAAAISLSKGKKETPLAAQNQAPSAETDAAAQAGTATNPLPDEATTEPTNPELDPENEPSGNGETETETDPSPENGDPTTDPANTDVKPKGDTEAGDAPKNTSRKNNNRKNNNRKNNNRKNTEKPEPKEELTADSVMQLYTKVGNSLDRLESKIGKDKARSIRNDYNSMNISVVYRDASMRPVRQQQLVRLRNKINQAMK